MKTINRRNFIKLASVSAVFAGTTLKTLTAAAKDKMVTMAHPMAKALNYAVGAKAARKSAGKPAPAKSGLAAKKQMCSNCLLYPNGSGAAGACPLFAGYKVAANDWCSSWNLKPKT